VEETVTAVLAEGESDEAEPREAHG
jgi:hypothetical protein